MSLAPTFPTDYRLRPCARLKKRDRIAHLFQHGKRAMFGPVQLCHCVYAVPEGCHQALFVVPKRHVRLAVHRHRLRRQVREAHRHHISLLQPLAQQRIFLLIGYLYHDSQPKPYATIVKQVQAACCSLLEMYIRHAYIKTSP